MDHQQPKKKRKVIKWVLLIFTLFIMIVVGYGVSVYMQISKTAEIVHIPIDRKPQINRETELELQNKEPFSVLMLGVDERQGDKGRSDTMILITVNPEKQSMEMLSIPRDTRVEIVGRGTQDKINHAYAFGGVEMAMNTVEKFLDIPIDYYIKMNMEGFMDIVDVVGGITVTNDMEFTLNGHFYKKGENFLNGAEALNYVRMRYDDERGDFGRQMRQRQVIQGVIQKGANISALWKWDDLLNAFGKNVETNITFDEMFDIQKNYRSALYSINQLQLKGKGKTIAGIWYFIVSEEDLQEIQNRLKSQLEI